MNSILFPILMSLSHADALDRLAQDKDFIAMDQSRSTHIKHMEKFGVRVDPASFDVVADRVRDVIRRTPNHSRSFSGRIEHIDQIMTSDGKPIESGLQESETVVICKLLGLDKKTGLIPEADMAAFPEQIAALSRIGVHVVKLRSTFYPGMPQEDIVHGIDQFVRLQQALAKQGDVSAVHEPEFLYTADGNTHDLQQNRLFMTMVLGGIAKRFRDADVTQHPWMLKTSIAAPGKASNKPVDPVACANATVQAYDEAGLPEDLNIYLLSGGHDDPAIRRTFQEIRVQRQDVRTSFSRTLLRQVYQAALDPYGTGETVTEKSPVYRGLGQAELHRQGVLNHLARANRYQPDYEDRTVFTPSDLLGKFRSR